MVPSPPGARPRAVARSTRINADHGAGPSLSPIASRPASPSGSPSSQVTRKLERIGASQPRRPEVGRARRSAATAMGHEAPLAARLDQHADPAHPGTRRARDVGIRAVGAQRHSTSARPAASRATAAMKHRPGDARPAAVRTRPIHLGERPPARPRPSPGADPSSQGGPDVGRGVAGGAPGRPGADQECARPSRASSVRVGRRGTFARNRRHPQREPVHDRATSTMAGLEGHASPRPLGARPMTLATRTSTAGCRHHPDLSMNSMRKATPGDQIAPISTAPMAYVVWTQFLHHHRSRPDYKQNHDRFMSCRARRRAALLAPAPDRLQRLAEDLEASARSAASRGSPRIQVDHQHRGDNRTTRPGPDERGRNSHRRTPLSHLVDQPDAPWSTTAPGSSRRTATSRKASRRRRPAGRGPPAPRQADRAVRRQPSSSSTARPPWPGRGTCEPVEAYGSHTQRIADGDDVGAIQAAVETALADDPRASSPSGVGLQQAPKEQDRVKAHGAPLGPDEVRLTKDAYGSDPDGSSMSG